MHAQGAMAGWRTAESHWLSTRSFSSHSTGATPDTPSPTITIIPLIPTHQTSADLSPAIMKKIMASDIEKLRKGESHVPSAHAPFPSPTTRPTSTFDLCHL